WAATCETSACGGCVEDRAPAGSGTSVASTSGAATSGISSGSAVFFVLAFLGAPALEDWWVAVFFLAMVVVSLGNLAGDGAPRGARVREGQLPQPASGHPVNSQQKPGFFAAFFTKRASRS